jgi:hypothetical protein
MFSLRREKGVETYKVVWLKKQQKASGNYWPVEVRGRSVIYRRRGLPHPVVELSWAS